MSEMNDIIKNGQLMPADLTAATVDPRCTTCYTGYNPLHL